MRTSDLEYNLPKELIATEPLPARDGGRLLVVNRARGTVAHHRVTDLPGLLSVPSLLVVNNTRVIPARLRGNKPTGGRVEILLLRAVTQDATRWHAIGRASKPIRPGQVISVAQGFSVQIERRSPSGLLDVLLCADDPMRAIETYGEVPLPPYMARAPSAQDRERYQTVFASRPGAVAAPTAGLHLSEPLISALAARGIHRAAVTLHVGMGTFAPVEVDDLDAHPMHSEVFEVPEASAACILAQKRCGSPVVAVGTTVVRALESWAGAGEQGCAGETRLLIQPGFTFQVIDQLLTNFHLPRSTLLALVMAFGGKDLIRQAYDEAIRERYRFYSYGDAMLIL